MRQFTCPKAVTRPSTNRAVSRAIDRDQRVTATLNCHHSIWIVRRMQRSDVEGRDVRGNTVLHLTAFIGDADVCRQLLQLHTATDAGSSLSLIDVLNDDGCTPLDLAKCKPTRTG